MHDAAVAINPDVIVLCHGGPIAAPEDARYVLERTHASRASSARRAWSACDRIAMTRHEALQGAHQN